MAAGRTLDFAREGSSWPHREASRFVAAGGLRWHVQDLGEGPTLLLLHGPGSTAHSWRGLVPLLRPHFRLTPLIFPDTASRSARARQCFRCPACRQLYANC